MTKITFVYLLHLFDIAAVIPCSCLIVMYDTFGSIMPYHQLCSYKNVHWQMTTHLNCNCMQIDSKSFATDVINVTLKENLSVNVS